jgi:hypothetical protein
MADYEQPKTTNAVPAVTAQATVETGATPMPDNSLVQSLLEAHQKGTLDPKDDVFDRLWGMVAGKGASKDKTIGSSQVKSFLADYEVMGIVKRAFASGIMADELDANKNKKVEYSEFRSPRGAMLELIAAGVDPKNKDLNNGWSVGMDPKVILAEADRMFTEIDTNKDGVVTYDELKARTSKLLKNEDQAETQADLSANVLLVAFDPKESKDPAKKRTITRDNFLKGVASLLLPAAPAATTSAP